MTIGFATVTIDDVDAERDGKTIAHSSFTDVLGCSATSVDGYRLPTDGTITLSAPSEQVCIPIDAEGPLYLGDGTEIPPLGITRVPAEVEHTLRCSTATSIAVIGAPAESAADHTPTTVDLEECDFAPTSTSAIETSRLTAPLGCAGMKINARILGPRQRIPYHREGDQEELFVPLRGPASMRIDGKPHETPIGTITRVEPPVPRSAVNDGDVEALWVMIGAPPTGGPTEWAPGVEIVE